MKLKGLFLGSAAGVLAISGVQAADLPVEPVEYVRVCSAYGAGFHHIPGNEESCLRLYGYVRVQYMFAEATNPTDNGLAFDDAGSLLPIRDNDYAGHPASADAFQTYARGQLGFDVRRDTDMGLLRADAAVNVTSVNHGTSGASLDHAYIQLGGFTFGYTGSFFEGFNGYELTDIGDPDPTVNLIAYTMVMNNGLSLSLSLEDPHNRTNDVAQLVDTTGDGIGDDVLTGLADDTGFFVPDVVLAASFDQGWGSVHASVAAHAVRDVAYPDDLAIERADAEIGFAGSLGVAFNATEGTEVSLRGIYVNGATGYGYSHAGFEAPTAVLFLNDAGEREMALGTGYTIVAGAKTSFDQFGAYVSGAYSDYEWDFGDDVTAGWSGYTVAGGVSYDPVEDLTATFEVRYTDAEYDDDDSDAENDSITALVRLQRSF